MYLQSLLSALGKCLVLAGISSMLTVTSVAKVPSSDLLQWNQENLHSLLGSLLIALILVLLVSVVFIRYCSPRRRVREQSAQERELAKLIEESVHAGQSALK